VRYRRFVALLSQLIRTVAITGRTDTVNAWFASRQGGRWAEQTVRDAFPNVGPHARRGPPRNREHTLRQLAELHERGVISDAEFENLRAGLRD
jgi:putative oligomerization/nucleic acid binding protein